MAILLFDWTQIWTQWTPYGLLRDTTRPIEPQRKSAEMHTEPHVFALCPTTSSVFQDRCLKPLGHPSALTTSNTYALPLAEQTSTLPPNCHRPPPTQLARMRVIGAGLILNKRGAPRKARAIDTGLMGQRSPLSETGPLKDLGAEKENPAKARGKSQVRRMSGQLGDWGNRKAVQPALHV
jgi:hypothetical protein